MKLTSSEWKLMELLWETGEPMTPAQIKEKADGWKPSYVHLMITSLLKKEVIQISGFVQTTKNYARAFTPLVTKEECMVREILGDNPDSKTIVGVVKAITEIADKETLDIIRRII